MRVSHRRILCPPPQHPLPPPHAQPGDPAPDGQSYIAASYVKWLEVGATQQWQGGARLRPTDRQLGDR